MAEGKGRMWDVRLTGRATGGELMGADMDEGEVMSTEDMDGIKPGRWWIKRITWRRKGGLIRRRIENRNIVDSGAELRCYSGNNRVMVRLKGREEVRRGRRVGRG